MYTNKSGEKMLTDISHYFPGFAEGIFYRAVVIDNVDPTNQGRSQISYS